MTTTNPTADTAVRSARGTGLGHPARSRAIRDQLARVVMWAAFFLAVIPLVWILYTVISKGFSLLLESQWWTNSQRGITSRRVGGGAVHAIQGFRRIRKATYQAAPCRTNTVAG